MSYTVQCPGCKGAFPHKGLAPHALKCPQWAAVGVPYGEFNWDRYLKRGPYAEGAEEGRDYVRCLECADVRKARLMDHIKKVHGLTKEGYLARHPGATVAATGILERRESTVRERYGVANVFQDPGVKGLIGQTMVERYGGVGKASPVLRPKIEQTMEARYGHVNPFGSPEIQERIKQGHLERYGVENPNQAPEVIARRMETNRQRYGAPHYLQTEEFKEASRETSRERYGTDHPMQSEAGRERQVEGCMKAFGAPNPLSVPEIFQKSYDTNLANHGGKHSQQCPEVLEKARATWLEKYGVDNPSKAEEIKARIKDVWMGKYGVPFPPQSLWVGRAMSFPNGLERKVAALAPEVLVYAGDGSYWVRHQGTSRSRNPDFVVLDQEQLAAYRSGVSLNTLRTYAVVEAFGDYWHGPGVTGKERGEHEAEVLDYYARAGIQCLIVWEGEVKADPAGVAARLAAFLKHPAGNCPR